MKAFEAVTGELDEGQGAAKSWSPPVSWERSWYGRGCRPDKGDQGKDRRAHIKDEGEIRKIVIEISANLNINLTDEQIEQIVQLMKKISNLDLNVEKIASQIEKIAGSLDDVKKVVTENKGVIKKILEAIERFFAWLRSLLG